MATTTKELETWYGVMGHFMWRAKFLSAPDRTAGVRWYATEAEARVDLRRNLVGAVEKATRELDRATKQLERFDLEGK